MLSVMTDRNAAFGITREIIARALANNRAEGYGGHGEGFKWRPNIYCAQVLEKV